jgi:hypothetical protein
MTPSARAKLFVIQMRRGRLHARSCRHDREVVDGPYRPSGRNASPSGITPPSIMSPARNQPGSWTEIRLSARAHTIRIPDRAHAPPAGTVAHNIKRPGRAGCGGRPAQIRSVAAPRLRPVRRESASGDLKRRDE